MSVISGSGAALYTAAEQRLACGAAPIRGRAGADGGASRTSAGARGLECGSQGGAASGSVAELGVGRVQAVERLAAAACAGARRRSARGRRATALAPGHGCPLALRATRPVVDGQRKRRRWSGGADR